MCGTCGCSDTDNAVTMTDMRSGDVAVLRHGGLHRQPERHNAHHHRAHKGEDRPHVHAQNDDVVMLESAMLARNDTLAAENRAWFAGRGVLALNLVSSPGAGKTTLLERTIQDVNKERPIYVIEGDQMTANDADRICQAGARAIQVNTGAGCHLEADMVGAAARALDPEPGSLLMIENVGNLVCPAMFDLGERMKVVVISTTEGEDKPLKYPHMFCAAELVLINKIDLAIHVDFDEEKCRANINTVNPDAKILALSAKTGEGMCSWYQVCKDSTTVSAPRREPALPSRP